MVVPSLSINIYNIISNQGEEMKCESDKSLIQFTILQKKKKATKKEYLSKLLQGLTFIFALSQYM